MSQFNELKIKSKIRDYSVKFVDDYRQSLKEDNTENSFILVDANVMIKDANIIKLLTTRRTMVINAFEKEKSYNRINPIIKTLIEYGIKRNSKLIAIGGGITQDITGFIASILFRGIDWVFYPTTLLAQCDSCIGSKTSINVEGYKNQIGTWYPPSKIILDTNFLKTLNKNDILSGMGEIIKVHLLNGSEGIDDIRQYQKSGFRNKELLDILIYRSLEIKKKFIEQDEFDKGIRNLLNYGHTFGHGIETLSNNKIPHGIAVAMGMGMANLLSYKYWYLSEEDYVAMLDLLDLGYQKISFNERDKKLFLGALAKDKKNIGKGVTAILTRGIGKMEKMEITQEILNDLTDEMIKRKQIW